MKTVLAFSLALLPSLAAPTEQALFDPLLSSVADDTDPPPSCFRTSGALHFEGAEVRAAEIFRRICGDRPLFETAPEDAEDEPEDELAQLGTALDSL